MDSTTGAAGLDRPGGAPPDAGLAPRGPGRQSDSATTAAGSATARTPLLWRVLGYAQGWPATVLIGLVAAAPVILAAVHALQEGWQPVADRGNVATRAFDVFSTHMPLTGPNSFTTELTGHPTFSLGPMLFWLLAPAAHIGAPQSFVLTMALVNTGSIVLAVALARRRGGVWLMLVAAAAIAVMCRSLTAADFYDIWNPAAPLMPFLALAFVSWSLACGEQRLAPLAVLLASFCVQCHNGFTFPSAGLLLVAAAGLFLSRRPRFAGSRPPRAHGRVWPWLAAAAAVLAICWTAPIADQIAGQGNIGHVLEAGKTNRSRQGTGVGVKAVVLTVGVRPWWLKTVVSPWSRKYEVHPALKSGQAITAAVLLGWLLLAAALALWRRRLDVATGAAAALAMSLATGVVASATPTGRILGGTLAYTLWSASIVGMFAWLIAAWSAVVLAAEALGSRVPSRARRSPAPAAPDGATAVTPSEGATAAASREGATAAAPPDGAAASAPTPGAAPRGRRLAAALALAAGIAAVAAASVYGSRDEQPDEHRYEFAAIKALDAGVQKIRPGSVVYLTARLDDVTTPLRPHLTFSLRRHGVRALGTGAYIRLGRWYELEGRRYDNQLILFHEHPPKGVSGKVLATGRLRFNGRLHTVGLLLAPGGRGDGHSHPLPAPAGPGGAAKPPQANAAGAGGGATAPAPPAASSGPGRA